MLAKIFGGAVLVVGGVFVLVILGTLMGGLAGWTVGLVFPDVLDAVRRVLHVSVTDFQLGAMLGFVGGFFRASVSK